MLSLSTEFFPMTEPASLRKLGKTWARLQAAGVSRFSLTFGALGAAQDKSTACLRYLRRVEGRLRKPATQQISVPISRLRGRPISSLEDEPPVAGHGVGQVAFPEAQRLK